MKTINFIVLFLYCIPSFANEGMQVGKDLRGHFKNFKSNIAQPMTSDTNFNTVDGSSNFTSNLTCSDQTKSFLEVTYRGTSDIIVNVKVDTNLDGIKNKLFSLTGVSGVGTNGVIKCSPNTWKNCKYYKYNLSNNNLFLEEIIRYDLGGGHCINSSCNSPAYTQKITVLDSLGGAISSLYQNSNSKYLITKTKNDGNKIEFYGQNYEDCQNYQDNKPTGSTDATNIIAEQSDDENSVYYTLNKNVENQNNHNFDNDVDNTLEANKGVSVEGDTRDYSFTYVGKQQNEDGSWSLNNDDAKVNINWANPDIKYCEVKFLEENTIVFSDGETHHSSTGDTQTWKTKIVECTGDDYSICPYDSAKGEIIKHQCGDIDNFAEATSIMMAVDEATDDFTCSN